MSNAQLEPVLQRLEWMRAERIWPDGLRYLWTDAFGVVLLLSLADELHDPSLVDEAEHVAREVERVLGRRLGVRIGEAPERGGQYYHYLAMWMFALNELGRERPVWRERAVHLAQQVHPRFVVPGAGVHWKMLEDLSAPWPGYGWGALDAFHGFVVYRLLDEHVLQNEITQLRLLVERAWPRLLVTQDLGLGMLLWMTSFFPQEEWASVLRDRALRTLDTMWVDPPGYFARAPDQRLVRIAFANWGVAIGLQAAGMWPQRVQALLHAHWNWSSGDEYDREAITHVMGCCARLPGRLLRRRLAATV
jgi:hypothetical protein